MLTTCRLHKVQHYAKNKAITDILTYLLCHLLYRYVVISRRSVYNLLTMLFVHTISPPVKWSSLLSSTGGEWTVCRLLIWRRSSDPRASGPLWNKNLYLKVFIFHGDTVVNENNLVNEQFSRNENESQNNWFVLTLILPFRNLRGFRLND